MKKSVLLCGLLLFFYGSVIYAQAQKKNSKRAKANKAYTTKKAKQDDKFLNTQWWLGFRGGVNLTQAEPTTLFSAFSPINFSEEQNRKTYDDFKDLAGQAGLEITFYHKGFSFSLQPNYRRQRFSYSNEFFWDGRAHLLRDQSLLPIQDPLEMNETLASIKTRQAEKLKVSKHYDSDAVKLTKLLALRQ